MKIKIFIISFFLSQIALSQTVVKSSVDNGGVNVSNGEISILYTLGEVNVQEFTEGSISISEGFINPILVNATPTIDNIIAPVDPIALGNVATVTVEFNDDNLLEGLIDWGVGSGSIQGDIADNTVVWNHTYTSPGVYQISIKLVDLLGEIAEETYRYIVIYDPYGGFITGGGWINSPAGAYVAHPLLEGKASFGFVAKYKKGSSVPTGHSEFQFKAGDLNFNSTYFDWLVVAGSKGMFKGQGTINGTGFYGFLISAIDNGGKNTGEADKFRIKIWEGMNEAYVVFDNELGEDDDADPTTYISGGSIFVQSKSGGNDKSKLAETGLQKFNVYPNPFTESTNIELRSKKAQRASIEVYDLYGRLVDRLYEGNISSDSDNYYQFNAGNKLTPGLYILRVRLDNDKYLTRNILYSK